MPQPYIIIHDPHSSSELPEGASFRIDPGPEIDLVTDWGIRDLIQGDETISFPYSRVWCDVERFTDDVLEGKGRGIAYTHTLEGQHLRDVSTDQLQVIMESYEAHHKRLEQAIEQSVSLMPVCLIDAHSFSDYQASFDSKIGVMPDICIGTNGVPPFFVRTLGSMFNRLGLSVGYNAPYSGALLPLRYHDHPDVQAVMIEVNKRLYMRDTHRQDIDPRSLAKLRETLALAISLIRKSYD